MTQKINPNREANIKVLEFFFEVHVLRPYDIIVILILLHVVQTGDRIDFGIACAISFAVAVVCRALLDYLREHHD